MHAQMLPEAAADVALTHIKHDWAFAYRKDTVRALIIRWEHSLRIAQDRFE
jgi:hypothetical protein